MSVLAPDVSGGQPAGKQRIPRVVLEVASRQRRPLDVGARTESDVP